MRLVLLVVLCEAVSANLGETLVYPRVLQERSDGKTKVVQVRDGLTLTLEKATVASERVLLRTFDNGALQERYIDGDALNKNLHQDVSKKATVALTETNNGVEMEGLVGIGLRIQPMREMERSDEGLVPHMITEYKEDVPHESAKLRMARGNSFVPTERSINTLPANIIIEVFLVFDNAFHSQFDKPEDLRTYAAIFMGSVNARYSTMANPVITLIIVGMELSQDEPYAVEIRGRLHDDDTLASFRTYAGSVASIRDISDMVLLITGMDLWNPAPMEGSGVTGVAYVAGVCTESFVGLVEDQPKMYKGVHTCAHEAAHLLGASHDGNKPILKLPNYPSAESCPWTDGYLMSYIDKGPHTNDLSECSQQQIRHVLAIRSKMCWKVVSKIGTSDKPRTLPGTHLTSLQLCKMYFPAIQDVMVVNNNTHSRLCKFQCCFAFYDSWRCLFISMLDGMSCGRNEMCYNGRCK